MLHNRQRLSSSSLHPASFFLPQLLPHLESRRVLSQGVEQNGAQQEEEEEHGKACRLHADAAVPAPVDRRGSRIVCGHRE